MMSSHGLTGIASEAASWSVPFGVNARNTRKPAHSGRLSFCPEFGDDGADETDDQGGLVRHGRRAGRFRASAFGGHPRGAGPFDLPLPDDEAWEAVFFGRPDGDGLAEWFLRHHVSADIEAVMADKLARFETRFAELVTPFEDGQWLARELQQHGLPLALVTGARRVEADLVLSRFDLVDVFSASVSSDESVAGKPDPIPYLMGAEALGVEAWECVVIEDAVPGLRAAEAAVRPPIVVDRLGGQTGSGRLSRLNGSTRMC